MPLLSKSKYLNGLQCLKYFWISLHEKERLPEVDTATQHKFDQGHLIGQLAKQLFSSGINIPETDFKKNLELTKENLKKNKPLFEPAFMVEDLYSRADILIPNGDGWDIIEVKSGTKVKDVNIQDVSFQKHVYEKFGLKIRKCFLMHINNEYVKKGEIDPEKLLKKEDITSKVEEAMVGIKDRINNMISVMESEDCPDIKISKDCSDPYDCPLEDYCWGFLPSSSVFDLYHGGVKCFKLLNEGVLALKDIPHKYKLTDKQGIQHKCEQSGKVHVNKEELKIFLGKLVSPIHYLDFETFMTAVPLVEGTRPYQQIPFQWSLHVDGEHYEYLAGSKEDPRLEFLLSLKKVIGSKGSIVTYNQSFEISRLRELGSLFPKYKDGIEGIVSRVIDLIVPFRSFSYYNPLQKGSCSLKYVLPAVIGRNPYADLKVNDGSLALISYLSMMYGDGEDVREDLLKYCELDTKAMVWIVRELRKLI